MEDNLILERFGRSLARHRQMRTLTQEELAHRSGLSRVYVSDLERGKKNPSLLVMLALAGALGVAAADLLGDVDG